MTGKERVTAIFNGKQADRVGFWLGNPADDTKLIYSKRLNLNLSGRKIEDIKSISELPFSDYFDLDLELHSKFGSDLFWVCPELIPNQYRHPAGKPMFDVYGGRPKESLAQPGIFAECADVKEVEAFEWPNPDYLNFDDTVLCVKKVASKDMAIFGGMWMPFFHIVAEFFGMENYFMKMYTDPLVVEAVTEKVLEFYLEANKRCMDIMAKDLTAQFFGNDLGSQLTLLIGPDQFRKFVLPGFKKIINQAKSYNLNVVLHSCGAVSDIIPLYIEAGIDGLHPLQAKAEGMDAKHLAKEFKKDLVFIGGVDTQEILPFKTPKEVYDEVERLKDIFGGRYIVSPSHEALLPNVSIENAMAMRDAAIGRPFIS